LADLAARAAQGERTAVRAIVEALAPRLLGVSRRIMGPGHADVEDVTQESLVAVLRALPGFQGESTVLHYATRIGARTCLAARKRARAIEAHRESFQRASVSAHDEAPQRGDAVALSRRRKEELRALLETLPEEQSETLVLRIVLGMSLEEVADSTGVPVNTVRSRIRLAKEALRQRIERNRTTMELLEDIE